ALHKGKGNSGRHASRPQQCSPEVSDMRIAIISDIHDNIWSLAKVLPRIADCDMLLCLGDFCAPFTLSAVAAGFKGQVQVVWGNNDGDKLLLTRNADKAGNVTLHGHYAKLELDNRLLFMNHYPEIAQPLAASGQFDLVCYGHDHHRVAELQGRTWLVNPGEVMGRFGVVSYAVYDTTSNQAQLYEL
ncbi:MAG: YfcE family phosphodiesterase, partial [Anaerolineae bacterium]